MAPLKAAALLLASSLSVGANAANFFADPGEDMVQGKPQAAARHLRSAVDRGDTDAMFELAHLYRTGTGVQQDLEQSTALYLQAAERGHVDAQYVVGVCFARGRGVAKDPVAARHWLERAAASGHEAAAERLALLRETGDATDSDDLEALTRQADVSSLRALLESGMSPDARDRVGTPVLHLATRYRRPEIVELLVERSVDVHAVDGNGDTALHIAAAGADGESYAILLGAGAEPDRPNRAGWTARQLKDRTLGEAQVAQATRPGADARLAAYRNDPRFDGWSALATAAWAGDEALVRRLVRDGAPMDADRTGYTPLARALQNGQTQIVTLLLEAGADAAAPETPLAPLAVVDGDPVLLAALIRKGMPVDARGPDGAGALHLALRQSRGDLAALLLDAGADPGLPDAGGVTALMLAAQAADAELVARMVRSGTDLSTTDAKGRSALHYAASGCEAAVFGPLAAMLPIEPDGDGRWPLHLAADAGCAPLAEALLDRGHAVDPLSAAGNTPLSLAAARGHAALIDTLVSHGADPNLRDRHGETALHRAVRGGHIDAVTRLLAAGASPSIRNANQRNAVDLATDDAIREALKSARPALFATFE